MRFQEVMQGWFGLGADEPQAGRRQGRAAGERLVLRAAIEIADLDAFIRRPGHEGSLAGTVRFPPLGPDLRGDGGVFRLFVADPASGERRMVYELTCSDGDGGSYTFAGEKHVDRRPPWWLWRDTTRLHSRLHRGGDRHGEVVAAGVLTLGPWQLARMLGTFRARPVALARFGAFFAVQLWRTYVRRRLPAAGGNPR